jgi:spore maturation protein CgeB
MRHDLVEFQYDLRQTFQNPNPADPKQKAFIQKNRSKVTKELLHQIRAAHAIKPVDLFFRYFYDACVLPEAIDGIKSMSIKTVNRYCNGSYQLHLVSKIAPHYDWCLVPEKFRLNDYVAMGARPIYCQEAANPNI